MGRYFGTDGIREKVTHPIFEPSNLLKLTNAVCLLLKKQQQLLKNSLIDRVATFTDFELEDVVKDKYWGKILIGYDTRNSSYAIASALTTGFLTNGFDVVSLGIAPTPVISFLTSFFKFALGVVVSASHNPYNYNGIKFFSPSGLKIPDEAENIIEDYYDNVKVFEKSSKFGKLENKSELIKYYVDYLYHKFHTDVSLDLSDLRIGIDCANGTNSLIVQEIFKLFNAKPYYIACSPNGFNINKFSGSLYPQVIQKLVEKRKLDIGFSYDGDGDRALLVTSQGNIIDGDGILAIISKYYSDSNFSRNKKQLKSVVGSVNSNLGLEEYLNKLGIRFIRTKVGDKYIIQAILENNTLLGGESSGHIIDLNFSVTGDGIITSLLLLKIYLSIGKNFEKYIKDYTPYEQVNINQEVPRKIDFDNMPGFLQFLKDKEQELANKGRIVVRYSGTEPVIRILVEGKDRRLIKNTAIQLAKKVKSEINKCIYQ